MLLVPVALAEVARDVVAFGVVPLVAVAARLCAGVEDPVFTGLRRFWGLAGVAASKDEMATSTKAEGIALYT